MTRLLETIRKAVHFRRRASFEASLDEEMRLHLEERAEDLIAAGVPPPEALAQARREFGSPARIAEESREAWRFRWIEDLARDLRYAIRALRRDRIFAATAVTSLALGIGLNTTIFSLTAEFLFSRPSVRDPDSLARVEIGGVTYIPLREYKFVRDAGVFDALAGANEMGEVNWRAGERAQRLFATRVTGNFFEVTGMPLALGRGIGKGEVNAAVISSRFFQSRLGGRPQVLGASLVLDGKPFTIVGILPAGHHTLTGFGYLPDLYLPLEGESARAALYGRMPAGVERAAVLQKLRRVCAELDRIYPDGNHLWARGIAISGLSGVERLQQGFLRNITAFFALMMTAVGLLLLIACANVAGLLLARASTRTQEFAIRMSIGAGRGRVIRQMLAESLLLSLLGSSAGLALNYALTRLLNRAVVAAPFPLRLAIEPDWRLLLYAAAVAVVCTLAAGVLPAWKSAAAGSTALLKRGERQVSAGRARLRNVLVAGQLALSVLVLVLAALSLRNLAQSARLDPGFDLRHTVWAQMRLTPGNVRAPEAVRAAVLPVLERLRAIPGVASASIAAVVPLNDHFLSRSTTVYAGAAGEGVRLEHAWNAVGPDYFRTMGIALVSGREFALLDRDGAPPVVILNEAFAARIFGKADAVGRSVRLGGPDREPRIVAGVARNSKYSTIGERDRPALYEPYLQAGGGLNLQFLVKASGAAEALLKPLNAALLDADPAASVESRPMSRALAFALLPSRIGAILLGSVGILGLALAAVGLYGVLAYTMARRTREIGLRIALGAGRRDVLALVSRECVWMIGGGLAAGFVLAGLAARPLERFLTPGLAPLDPVAYAAVAATLAAAGCAAALAPLRRALRVDPMTALRYD